MSEAVIDRAALADKVERKTKEFYEYIADDRNGLKNRLMAYLMTPKLYSTSLNSVPRFLRFEGDYGCIDWAGDFPYLKPEQAVNVQMMVESLINGNLTFFPKHWTDDMLQQFVLDVLDMGCHEFDMYIDSTQYQYQG